MATSEVRIDVDDAIAVSGILERPADARAMLALAHGAGAGMRHPFLTALARELAAARVATLRYQFPYMEQQRRVPDTPAVLTATVRAAVRTASAAAPDLPLLTGGKSLGGRMTSTAAAQNHSNAFAESFFSDFRCILRTALEPSGGNIWRARASRCFFCRARAMRWPISIYCARSARAWGAAQLCG